MLPNSGGNLTEILNDHGFCVVAVLRGVIGDQVVRQFMGHNNTPVDDSIGLVALLDQRQVQVLKISVVKEEGFVLIESNGAASVVIENVHCRAIKSECVCAVQENCSEEFQCRGICFLEFGGT